MESADTAKIPQGGEKKKPPRAEVAQLLGDPVVRGKPFLNSVEKAYTSGTSVITEATRPVCQAGLMWSPDQVLFLAPVALRSPCTPRSYRSEHMLAPCTADSPLSVLRCVRTAASTGQHLRTGPQHSQVLLWDRLRIRFSISQDNYASSYPIHHKHDPDNHSIICVGRLL